jgi:O-glycosyl hydrolase
MKCYLLRKQIFLLAIILAFTGRVFSQDTITSWDIDFSTAPPFSPYDWADAYTFDQSDGMLKVTALAHPWDRFVFWAKPFDISVEPYCDFHIKSDVAQTGFVITFKNGPDYGGQTIDVTFNVPADTVNWTYVYIDLNSLLGTLDDPILDEVQWDPVAAGRIWIDDFRMGVAAKPELNPPTMDPLSDMLVYKNAGQQKVSIKGITDGEAEIVQPITVTVKSLNTAVIPNPTKSALQGDSIVLSFTPVPDATGEAYIWIKLVDNGAVANTTIDSFKVVVMEYGGTGYLQDFNTDTMPDDIPPNIDYSLSLEDSALRIDGSRNLRWLGFEVDLGASYDISGNPYLNVKVKAERDFVLQAFLVDFAGDGYEIEEVGDQYLYNELVPGKNFFLQNRIYKGDDFVNVLFDFTGADPDIVDLSRISKIKFVANGTALTFTGTFFFDDIALGEQAEPLSYIGQVPDQSFYMNAPGTMKVLIPEIRNTEDIIASGAENLIENVLVNSITYVTKNENNRTVTYGNTMLEFTLKADAEGTDTVILTSVGKAGFENNVCKFMLTVASNYPPTIDALDSVVTKVNSVNVIKLSGIADGDRDVVQDISIVAVSSNNAVINDVNVDYTSDSRFGEIEFTALTAGEANITVYVIDDEDDSTSVSFKVSSFNSLNAPPTVNQVDKTTVVNNAGQQIITLTGISDGDGAGQALIITASSSNTGVTPDPVINYTQGASTAELVYTPVLGSTAATEIKVTISDDGGTANNNGDKTTVMSFELETINPPTKGYVMDLSMPNALSYFQPEGLNEFYWIAIVDTLGTKALRIKYTEKWTFGGIWFELPKELDVSDHPVVSYDILSVGQESWHWNYFYEVHGSDGNLNRNIQNTDAHQFLVPADELTTVSFDYRDPGDMNNSVGTPIDASRVNALLMNLHNTEPTWPFTNSSGLVYYMDIRFGDSAVYEKLLPYVTIDNIPDQSVFENSGENKVILTGLSDGKGSTEGLTLTAVSSRTDKIPNPVIGEVDENGNAILTYIATDPIRANITVTINHTSSIAAETNFYVSVINKEPNVLGNITIDRTEKHQTVRGIGTFETSSRFADLYAEDMGGSVVRVGIIGIGWEDVNDNNDPFVLNMDGFNLNSFNWDYYRDLKAKGVETFILTSWSPPAWMKRNLSEDHKEQAIEWENTDNILEPYYYDEFAESMVGVVKAFKDQTDIDILALGLQNEPYFNEPYPSAILSGEKFAELIALVGDRFAAEGLGHVGFFMPEQVFGTGWGNYGMLGYLSALKANAKADAYCDYFAVHGYDNTGVTSGFPSFAGWTSLWNAVQEGNNPKELWMSETHVGYTNFDNAMSVAVAIHGSLWAGNISLWTNWSFEDMQMTNNSPNSTFWVTKNFARYIRPGAVRVTTESDYPDLLATAYENTDGSFTIVVINKSTQSSPARFAGNNLPEEYKMYRTTKFENCLEVGSYNMNDGPVAIPGKSVVTFVAEKTSNLTIDYLADVTVDKNSGEKVVDITGISNGAGSTDNLTLTFENDNPGLFSSISVSAIDPAGTATLTFTPTAGMWGYAKITLKLSDDQSNTRDVSFYIIVGDISGVIEPEKTDVIIYPVPAQESINILVEDIDYNTITIRDLTGRVFRQANIGSSFVTLDINDLPGGIYLLELSGKNKHHISKFIVQ